MRTRYASLFPLPSSLVFWGFLALAGPLAAQQGVPSPDRIRQQIQASGLTPDQIRARLQSAGYSGSLLDAYLGGGAVGPVSAPTRDVFAALGALGIEIPLAEGLEVVPVDTGFRRFVVEPDTGIQLFGARVFRERGTQFQPVLSGPVPATYRVGPGDVMVLVLTGDVEFAHTLEITREGFIVIPQVGQIYVSGLSMEALRGQLRERLGRSYSGIRSGTTRFDVTIARLRTNQVYVIGEAVQPGAYQLASVATVLNALYAAGGPTDRGNFRRIEVRRGTQVAATLDLYDYLVRGETAGDIMLEQGDVVFIPVHDPRVTVTGPVVRPAIYELKPGQTLADVIALAGGFRPEAMLRRVTIHRLLPPAQRSPSTPTRAAIDVQLGAREAPATGNRATLEQVVIPALALEDGDSVAVDLVLPLAGGRYVTVTGMVQKPGRYPWREGLTLKELVTLARGPRVGADLREAEIARLPDDRSQGQMARTLRVPLDSSYLFERDSLGRYTGAPGVPFPPAGSAPDVVLEPYDNALILQQPNFEFQRTVKIVGEVEFPGEYALTRKDERLSDLVTRSGGLLPTAYPGGTQFFRAFARAGRVDINLAEAIASPGVPGDVIMQPGDSVFVPEYIPTVRVEGGVNTPSSVLYREGAGLDYYIDNAGGYARNADKGRISVRYANGSAAVKSRFLFFTSTPTPDPGSVIVVPTRPEKDTDVRGLIADITQIVATLATLAIVALRR